MRSGWGYLLRRTGLSTRLFIVAAVGAATLAVFGAAASTGSARSGAKFNSVVVTTLSGKNEVPKAKGGSGTARVTLNLKTGKACWRISVKGLTKTLSAHVHKAAPGKTGPVVIPLGARFLKSGCVTVPKTSLKAVGTNPRGYYVNVHTRKYPNGAIRGQLRPS
jgi:hypothetical protein